MSDDNTISKYCNCEYCNILTDCRLIRRLYQERNFKHKEPFLCNECIITMKGRGEIGTHPHSPKMLVFARDMTSQRKF